MNHFSDTTDEIMIKTFLFPLLEIQPSQLYINAEKLAIVKKQNPTNFAPVPLKKLAGKIIFTDGHTRALALYLQGYTEIEAVWDEDDLDWQAYEICLRWCEEEKIFTIADLQNRILPPNEYKIKWMQRCREI